MNLGIRHALEHIAWWTAAILSAAYVVTFVDRIAYTGISATRVAVDSVLMLAGVFGSFTMAHVLTSESS